MRGAVLIVEGVLARWTVPAARGLAAAGWRVGVASHRPSLAAPSRAVQRSHRLPELARGALPFVAAVVAALVDGDYDVVLPASDTALLALAAHQATLRAALPSPAYAVVARALDKIELARAVESVGLRSPPTAFADDALATWTGPALVKPRGRAATDGRPVEAPTRFCATPRELTQAVAAIEAGGDRAVLQAPVPGRLGALTMVVDRYGAVRARVQQRTVRTWPVRAGVSAYARVVDVDEELAAGVEALLAELGWVGLAQVQFLEDDDGTRHVIDLNGRLYGSIALAVGAGVNLPAAWAAVGTGTPFAATEADVGSAYQWLAGDLKAAVAARGRDGLRPVLGAGARAARSHHSLWAAADPAPALHHYLSRPLERLVPWTRRTSPTR